MATEKFYQRNGNLLCEIQPRNGKRYCESCSLIKLGQLCDWIDIKGEREFLTQEIADNLTFHKINLQLPRFLLSYPYEQKRRSSR